MALGRDAKIGLIKRVPLFEHCTKRELAQIASIADELDLPAGKKLTREGERGREFVVLLEGPPRYTSREPRWRRSAPATSSARSRC